MDVIEYLGSASVSANFKIPVVAGISDDDLRSVAWQGFKFLIADAEEPPSDFVVNFEVE